MLNAECFVFRCGDVFCMGCVKYKMRLSKLANPDPEGKTRKVGIHSRSWSSKYEAALWSVNCIKH